MAQDPKKQQPNDEQPQDDASLPPWLRNAPVGPSKPAGKEPGAEEPPAKPVIPRLVRRPSANQEQPDESIPPWLRGLDAPEEKKIRIGGTEVTGDFFDSADDLADSQDSDLTFDNWIAEQAEAQREKSVEEEIPDMFAGFDEDESEDKPASAYAMRDVTGGTSQLPDWFLGLEELDDKDAPDWVRQIDTGSFDEEPPPPEPPKPDPITDFFRDMGEPSGDQDDSYPDMDVPSAGFFQDLVGKSPSGSPSGSPSKAFGFEDDDDEDLPDLGSVTGGQDRTPPKRSEAPQRSEQQLRPKPTAKPTAKPTGGETRRLNDDEFDLPSAPSASSSEWDEPPLRDMGERVGGQTIRFDDWESQPPQPNQTIRFDDPDDGDEPSGTRRFDQEDDFFAPSTPSTPSTPPARPPSAPRANDTIRFDEDDIFSLQANETVHFDDFDEFSEPEPPARAPAPSSFGFGDTDDMPAEGSETIHFDEFDDPDMPAEKQDVRRGLTGLFNRGRGGRDKRDKGGRRGGKETGEAAESGETIHFDDLDDAFFEAPTIIQSTKPQSPVEIPQNELDAFLEGIDSPSASGVPSTDDIEDPDLDLFVERRAAPEAPSEPDFEMPMGGEDSLSWLSEIDSMVTAATRALDPRAADNMPPAPRKREEPAFDDRQAAPPEAWDDDQPQIRSRTAGSSEDAFSWDELPEAPEASAGLEDEVDWLSGIEAEDAENDAPTTRIPRPEDIGLSGLIQRSRQPEPPSEEAHEPPALPARTEPPTPGIARRQPAEPTPEPSAEEDSFDFASLYASDDIAAKALDSSSWNIPADLAPDDSASTGASEFEILFDEAAASDSLNELEEWERIVQGASTPDDASPNDASPASSLYDDDPFGDLRDDAPQSASAVGAAELDSTDIPDEELHSGWLTDDLLDSNPQLDAELPANPPPRRPIDARPMNDEDDDLLSGPGSSHWELPPSTVEDDLFDFFQANSDTIDLGEFEARDIATPASDQAPQTPSSRLSDEPPDGGSDTIDFGQWDLPAAPPVTFEPGEGDGIDTLDFGDWDAPKSPASGLFDEAAGDGVETLDVGPWDGSGREPLSAIQPGAGDSDLGLEDFDFGAWETSAPRVPSAFEVTEGDEIETLKFGEFDTPETDPTAGFLQPADAGLESMDFGSWETPQQQLPGDYTPAEGEEIDTLKFGEFDTPADEAIAGVFQPTEEEEVDTLDFEEFEEDPSPPSPPRPLPVTSQLRRTEELQYPDLASQPPGEGSRDGRSFDAAADDSADTFDFGSWEDDPSLNAGFAPAEGEAEDIDAADFGLWSDDQPAGAAFPSTGDQFAAFGPGEGIDTLDVGGWELDLPDDDDPSGASSSEPRPFEASSWNDDSDDAGAPRTPAQFDAPTSPTDPFRTQLDPGLKAVDHFELPSAISDSQDIEEAASSDFVSEFGLGDESRPNRPAGSQELFELEDIFASLDSEPEMTQEDTHPQPVFLDDSPTLPPDPDEEPDYENIFAEWGQEKDDAKPAEELFAGWEMYDADEVEGPDLNAPPSTDVPETFTSKRATSTITTAAVPPADANSEGFDDDGDDGDDSYLAAFEREEPEPFTPVTGLGEGMDWAREFTADQAEREAAAEIDSFFQNIDSGSDAPPAGKPASPFDGPFEDLDTYLDSLDAEAPQVSQQTNVVFNRPDAMDIDALLDQQIASARERRPGFVSPFEIDSDDIEAADLNFLQGMGASVDEVSAGAIVRQRQDRPEEELPERLRKLRKRAGQKKSDDDAAADDSLTEMLPGVSAGLSASYVGRAQEPERREREQGQQVSSEQRTRADLLRSLVGVAAAPKRMSAIEMTYDSPFMRDIESDEEIVLHPTTETEAAAVAPVVRRRRRQGLRVQPDRLLIVLLLAVAVIAPFVVPALRVGDPPPSDFTRDPLALTGFVTVDRLTEGDLALVALEYNPAAAGELDVLTNAILRHILLRGATPVVISGNPLALLRAESQFVNINADAEFLERINVQQPLEQNYEYALARYLPGGMIGLRAFSADAAALLASDLRGQTSSLYIQGLNDFALMVVITDSGETLRDYAEQIAPYSRAHVVGASTYAAAPLAEPYARSEAISGLLVGFGDGLTYESLLPGVAAVERQARIVRTPPPTPEPGTEQGSFAGSVEVTPPPTEESTAEPTPETTPPPLVAIVTAGQRVNVRAEPNGTIIGGADPGTRVFVLGSNEDGSWANVRLEEGAEGWISASLLTLTTPEPRQKSRRGSGADPREQDVDVPMTNTRPPTRATEVASPSPSATPSPASTSTRSATRTPRPPTQPAGSEATEDAGEATVEASPTRRPTATPSNTPEPTETPEPTATPTDMATPTETSPPPTPEPLTFSEGLRDERWYGINLGIIASVLIIGGGAIANIGRALVRGRRRRDR